MSASSWMGGPVNPIPALRRKMLLGKEERKNEWRTEKGARKCKARLTFIML